MHLNTWSIEGDTILGVCNHLEDGVTLEEVGCWVYNIEIYSAALFPHLRLFSVMWASLKM